MGTAAAATTDPDPGSLELANAELSRRAATEGMVLLRNDGGALPIAGSGTVALFGVGAYATVKGGTGSGDVNNRYTVVVREAFEDAGYTVTTSSGYWDAMVEAYRVKYEDRVLPRGEVIDYSSVEQPLTAQTAAPVAGTSTAVYVVTRNSGEFGDRTAVKGDFYLSDVEAANIELLGRTYDKVAVVLNVGGIVDTSFVEDINSVATDPTGGHAVDSLLLMSQPGQEAGHALVDVLDGTVTPSGKLTDTWASDYTHYPASATFGNNDGQVDEEVYGEGIYVGYRWFDSFYRSIDPADPASVVSYPFGYGLSYTDFSVATDSVETDAGTVTVTATVTNTGDTYSGREVVQVYTSAPQGELDQPYQELAGYAKTDVLAPGEQQTVTVSFRLTDLASYDEGRAAYVLGAGDYVVRVGDGSRSTEAAAVLTLRRTIVTEQLSNQQDAAAPAEELTPDPAGFYAYAAEARQIAEAPRLRIAPSDVPTVDNASEHEQDVPVDATSVYAGLDDDSLMSSVQVYLDADQTDWEGTGSAYQPRTGEEVQLVETDPEATLYDVARGEISIEQFVAGLDATALANVVEGSSTSGSTLVAVGSAGYTTAQYEQLGIPAMALADGPAGLRLTREITATDPVTYQFGTAFPIGTMLAQTWDPQIVGEVGVAIGEEMTEYGVHLWLAPGMNIHRDPFNGRNFEYYSEDPLVTGSTAAAVTAGVQSNDGVGVTIKHFAANSQQANQNFQDSVISERALREIYLKGFEIAVKQAQPMAVMTSWNKINGRWTSASYDLVTDVLRGEWDFEGVVMTDWRQVNRSGALVTQYSGNDLIMPGNNPAEILAILRKTSADVDVAGLPVVDVQTQETQTDPVVTHEWALGQMTLAAGGGTTVSTTVDAGSISEAPRSTSTSIDLFANETVTPVERFGSVDDAYHFVTGLLASGGLTEEQRAAISVLDVQRAVPGDETSDVVRYTVSLAGDYPDDSTYALRLGDLQRSAIHALDAIRQSFAFGELAAVHGVTGIEVGSYSAQFDDLVQYVTVTRGDVEQAPAPTVTDLREEFGAAVDAGLVSGPVAVQGRVHLQLAERMAARGKVDQAVRQVDRFIDRLENPGRASRVDPGTGAELTDLARQVIEALS